MGAREILEEKLKCMAYPGIPGGIKVEGIDHALSVLKSECVPSEIEFARWLWRECGVETLGEAKIIGKSLHSLCEEKFK